MRETDSAARTARLIHWLALAGVAIVLLVTTTSAYLRVTAAGLGCEDWPACYGQQSGTGAQPATPARLIHRVSATLAGTVVLAIGMLAFTQRRRFSPELRVSALLLLITVGLATLGRATPGALVPAVAIGNVLGGMLMASLLWWLALGPAPARPVAPGWVRTLSWVALLLTVGQIGLGVLTSASFSGLACPALPLCTADGFPGDWSAAELDPWTADTGRASAHMAHRLMALAATGAVAVLAVSRHTGKRARLALLALLALQALVGVSLIALALPLALAVVHNLMAALLLLALVAAHHGLTRRSETASDLI